MVSPEDSVLLIVKKYRLNGNKLRLISSAVFVSLVVQWTGILNMFI